MQHNLVGRLLGPKGLTLKRMQAETQTKMSILGRTSMRDRKKEEELRNSDDPTHQHLKDDLHVLVQSEPPFSSSKLAAGVAEVKKMLIPLVSVVCAIECCITQPFLCACEKSLTLQSRVLQFQVYWNVV